MPLDSRLTDPDEYKTELGLFPAPAADVGAERCEVEAAKKQITIWHSLKPKKPNRKNTCCTGHAPWTSNSCSKSVSCAVSSSSRGQSRNCPPSCPPPLPTRNLSQSVHGLICVDVLFFYEITLMEIETIKPHVCASASPLVENWITSLIYLR